MTPASDSDLSDTDFPAENSSDEESSDDDKRQDEQRQDEQRQDEQRQDEQRQDEQRQDEQRQDEQRQDEQRQDEQRRVGLYARVSTGEDRQTSETQLRHLREYADRRGFAITEEYVDKASGLDTDRPEYRRILQDARQRVFDVYWFGDTTALRTLRRH